MFRRLSLCVLLLACAGCDVEVVDQRDPVVTAPSPVIPGALPNIALFIAEPSRIVLGQQLTLRWDVTLPTGLTGVPVTVRIDPQPGVVPSTGTTLVQPFQTGLFTAVLTAETNGGQRASRFVQVVVQ